MRTSNCLSGACVRERTLRGSASVVRFRRIFSIKAAKLIYESNVLLGILLVLNIQVKAVNLDITKGAIDTMATTKGIPKLISNLFCVRVAIESVGSGSSTK